jgi:hypothetical protein
MGGWITGLYRGGDAGEGGFLREAVRASIWQRKISSR